MSQERLHRKTVQHFDFSGHARELTFSCYQRMALLVNDHWRKLLSQSIYRAIEKQGFDLLAFVYMPSHVHLLVFPKSPSSKVDRLLYGIKRPFSSRVKRVLQAANDPLLRTLTIRERPGKQSFRFWQEGPGYDRNLTSLDTVTTAIEYIHNNPVRRELCQSPEQWKWSSWKFYHCPAEWPEPDLPTVHGFQFGGGTGGPAASGTPTE